MLTKRRMMIRRLRMKKSIRFTNRNGNKKKLKDHSAEIRENWGGRTVRAPCACNRFQQSLFLLECASIHFVIQLRQSASCEGRRLRSRRRAKPSTFCLILLTSRVT